MNALLIIAHGSRRQASNDEVKALATRLRSRLEEFNAVTYGFLELATPDIESAARSLIHSSASTITVFPFFLVAGRHVAEDIPGIIARLRQAYPQTTFRLLDYFGAGSEIDDLVVKQIRH